MNKNQIHPSTRIMVVSKPHSHLRLSKEFYFDSYLPRIGEKIMVDDENTVVVSEVIHIPHTKTIKLLCI